MFGAGPRSVRAGARHGAVTQCQSQRCGAAQGPLQVRVGRLWTSGGKSGQGARWPASKGGVLPGTCTTHAARPICGARQTLLTSYDCSDGLSRIVNKVCPKPATVRLPEQAVLRTSLSASCPKGRSSAAAAAGGAGAAPGAAVPALQSAAERLSLMLRSNGNLGAGGVGAAPRAAATRAAARRPRATPATTPADGRQWSARIGTASARRMLAIRHAACVITSSGGLGGRPHA
jgi:hypothetical protein